MDRITRETLHRIVREFPTVPWDDPSLEGLVAPGFGSITGFQAHLAGLEQLGRVDLGTLGPAAALRPYAGRS